MTVASRFVEDGRTASGLEFQIGIALPSVAGCECSWCETGLSAYCSGPPTRRTARTHLVGRPQLIDLTRGTWQRKAMVSGELTRGYGVRPPVDRFSLLNADRTPRPAYTKIQQARTAGYLPD